MIKLALIGAGMVADTHVRAIQDLADEARIVGVHARRQEALHAFCAKHGLEPDSDLDGLIARADAVIVLTPPNARTDIISRCIAHGKPVLMEKPIERTTAAAEAIVADMDKAGLPLGIVFQNRFHPSALKLAELVEAGSLGELGAVQIAVPWWRPQSYYDVEGRGTYARDGGGVLINQAIHTLDLMQVFTGPVASVAAIATTTRLHRMEGEDFVAGGLVFAKDVPGSLVATTAHYPGEAESILLDFASASVRLQAGVLTVSHHDGRIETFGDSGATGGGADPMAFSHASHKALIGDFLAALREGRPPAVTGHTALLTHRLIDALMASARQGRRIDLPGN